MTRMGVSTTWMIKLVRDLLSDQGLCLLTSDNGEPEWVLEHARDQRKNAMIEKKRKVEDRLQKIRMEEIRRMQGNLNGERQPKRQVRRSSSVMHVHG